MKKWMRESPGAKPTTPVILPILSRASEADTRARRDSRQRGSYWLNQAIQADQRPALLVGGCDQAGEVGQQTREPVALGGDERLLVSGLEQRQRLRDPGALRVLGRAGDLLDLLEQLPALAPARGRDRPPLGLGPGAAAALPVAAHLPV
jgi:hypothetical protein